MLASCVAPPVELPVEKKSMPVSEPKPAGLKQRVRDLLFEIFAGHEEFLGCTPD